MAGPTSKDLDEGMSLAQASRVLSLPTALGERLIEVRASIGVHTVARTIGAAAGEIIDLADQAMFREKQSNGSRVPAPVF